MVTLHKSVIDDIIKNWFPIFGSLELMPSACLGDDKAYYENSHGSAPDIAGKISPTLTP